MMPRFGINMVGACHGYDMDMEFTQKRSKVDTTRCVFPILK